MGKVEEAFDYDKLTPAEQDLWAHGYNTGSKAAWEQAKREHDAYASAREEAAITDGETAAKIRTQGFDEGFFAGIEVGQSAAIAEAGTLELLEEIAKRAQDGQELPLTGEAIMRLYAEPSDKNLWELEVDWGSAPTGWNEEKEPAFYYYCNGEYSSRADVLALLGGQGE